MRKYRRINRCSSTAEQNIHTFNETCSCSLWLPLDAHLTGDSCPNLVTRHFSAISPGDCSLFSKGNEKVSLRRATKSLQQNKKKTFTGALWLLSSLPFSWAGCAVNRSCPLLELQSVPPSHTQPPAVCVYSPAGDAGGRAAATGQYLMDAGLHPRLAERTSSSAPSQPISSQPIPSHLIPSHPSVFYPSPSQTISAYSSPSHPIPFCPC